MAKMKFGEGLQLEIPLKEVIQPPSEVIKHVEKIVEVPAKVDLSPMHNEITELKRAVKELKSNIQLNKLLIENKEPIVKPEVKEITIYKNDSDEIDTLVAEVKAIDVQCQLNGRLNKDSILYIKNIQRLLNEQVLKQSIVNIVLGLGLILLTITNFI